jgi:hypothetical protein
MYNQQNIAQKVLRDFCEKIDFSKPNASLNFDYQSDQVEKLRILRFYEDQVYS